VTNETRLYALAHLAAMRARKRCIHQCPLCPAQAHCAGALVHRIYHPPSEGIDPRATLPLQSTPAPPAWQTTNSSR